MTWAERVGDLATNLALVVINAFRILTVPVRVAAEKLDDLVTSLAERSETGISRTPSPGRTWVAIIAQVAWGIAAVVLRVFSVVTVLVRQVVTAIDEFFRDLAEAQSSVGSPQPPTPSL
ncbi:hypothetical protein BMS3Abin02_01567 [bacterium BMS3Abin02]|nr:hypothetical protein BMS3Abin02_01567 [bacterium BMS3Abin02]GBE23651.1 hypothetical protein BMS3Bbin01_03036 [bacterium BMS3Bbin01]HDH26361.1 hypothetical protein [Actinomycetota bacterium]HDK44736.1 hypothetical protein [Actinomycetota bacterium]HDL49551.1 hypothetical protein [Actinomycetota bacterium]